VSTYYLDASAAVKYYILEPGSLWVRKLVDAPDAFDEFYIHTVLLSDPSIVECAAAFSVLHRVQRITRRTRDGAFEAFTKHVASGRYGLIAVATADFRNAAQLTQRHPLKAYDAVQLAVALRQNRALALVERSLIFVSGGRTLLSAVQGEGLATDNPFDHVSSLDTPQVSPSR
jgi:predicted nucleic acid-binding protein